MEFFSQIMRAQLSKLSYWLKSPFLDIGNADDAVFLIGMGRSGTTWVANIINYDKSYRVVFEPFFPAKVGAAKSFEYIQYMRPDEHNPRLADGAKKIFAGKIRGHWVDQDNRKILYRRRIIKDIRCNLMAAWLRNNVRCRHVIVLIRHPLQVALSWRKLGWGRAAMGVKSDFEIITSQEHLLEDFPVIRTAAAQIDRNSLFERLIFQWGVFHLVPLAQLEHDETCYLFYENLLNKPEDECDKLFRYLHKDYSWGQIKTAFTQESITNFLGRSVSGDQRELFCGWKNEFTQQEISRSNEILSMFGFDEVYDDLGLPVAGNLFCS